MGYCMNEALENALKTGKIAGAYLIEGATGEAVRAESDGFLQRLFCTKGTGCGACGGCLKYGSRNHADLLFIETEAKTIKVDEVRSILPFVYNKSYEGGYKAVLIPEADRMTDQAQNALLKVLEEPPADTVLLLGAQDAKNLLPTIRSRCIILKTQTLGDAEQRLMEEFSLSTLKARVLLAVANGDYYLAKKYAQQGYFELRDDMILALNRLFVAKSMATSATEKLFLAHEQQLAEAIATALLYLRDVLVLRHTGDASRVANTDKLAEIEKHAMVPDVVLVNTAELLNGLAVKLAQCPGLNKKLVLTGTLFDILEVRLKTLRAGA
ncbi:hypothetical protein LJC56_10175 [Christensenellaceae bacterium OttesenSCG-928-K19]|nr:hypothetical protein [Christensenellaceae bacterium OttesenSCG-928-K19]